MKTVIFDIGQVLMKFDWTGYVKTLFNEETVERVTKAIWSHGYWNELDVGVRSEEDILQSMIDADPSIEKEIRIAFSGDALAMGKHDYAIPWIKELKAMGYQVLFLSNYSKHVMKSKWEVLDFLPHMDGGIFSFMVHEVKPDAAIYRLLIEKYHLEPSECLFIDDKPENIEAARALGMQGIVFEGYEKSYPIVMEILRKK